MTRAKPRTSPGGNCCTALRAPTATRQHDSCEHIDLNEAPYRVTVTPWDNPPAAPPISRVLPIDPITDTLASFMKNIPTVEQRAQTAALNDIARANIGVDCTVIMTPLFLSLGTIDQLAVETVVAAYDNWTIGNTYDAERDFGVLYKLTTGDWSQSLPQSKDIVEIIFWKIDYLDRSFSKASNRPWDKSVTERMLTLMLAVEY